MNFIFFGFVFLLLILLFIGGNGINVMIKLLIMIKIIVIMNSVWNDIFVVVIILIVKGNINCLIEIENLVNILVMVLFFVKIFRIDGVMVVFKNEFVVFFIKVKV